MNSKYKITYFFSWGDEYTGPSDKSSRTDVDVCSKTDVPTDGNIFETQSTKPETNRLEMEFCSLWIALSLMGFSNSDHN